MFLQLLLISILCATCKANISPSEDYPHYADLDPKGKMILYWKFDEIYITFEVKII